MLIYNISALKFIQDTQEPTTSSVDDNNSAIMGKEGESSRTLKRKRVKI
jgi:hypothetical protein